MAVLAVPGTQPPTLREGGTRVLSEERKGGKEGKPAPFELENKTGLKVMFVVRCNVYIIMSNKVSTVRIL